MSNAPSDVLVDLADGVLRIGINRPKSMNAVTTDALDAVADTPDGRVEVAVAQSICSTVRPHASSSRIFFHDRFGAFSMRTRSARNYSI